MVRRVTDLPEPQKLASGLYIVATPIGNLGDISLRAKDILSRCDAVACEDTRVTGKLLNLLGISRPLRRYDDHASENARQELIARMQDEAIALVSDAGMPLVSDPGYRLVREARVAGIAVTVVPGASAPLMALAMSGMPNDRFLFGGFLPVKDKARAEILEELGAVRSTLIFFETAPRLTKSLSAIAELYPTREVAVARELTKMHEECRTGTAAELVEHYSTHPPKGEIVLLVGPPSEAEEAQDFDVDALLIEAMKQAKPSQAASAVAKRTGQDRRTLYARAMELRGQ